MSQTQHQRAKALFLSALERPAAERRAFLLAQAPDDPALIGEVELLLEFHNDDAGDPRLSMSDSESLPRDTRYADRYRILELVGRGGMGEVYRALDTLLNVEVALKRLTLRGEIPEGLLRNEVRLARRITHPAVCRVYDLGRTDGELYITMELIDGESLSTFLQRVGRLPEDRVIAMARSLCGGLAAAHANGVIHRDLKPSNILIDKTGQVHITDFGIATTRQRARQAILSPGTPSYMAPEQMQEGGRVTERSDLYSLALVLVELLTGQQARSTDVLGAPWAIPPVSSRVGDVSPELERILTRTLSVDPGLRPASALDMAAALPGGDVFHVAEEAGVAPSAALVAGGNTRPPLAARAPSAAWLALLAVLLASTAGLAGLVQRFPAWGNESHPRVRAHAAAAVVRELGFAAPSGTVRWGYLPAPEHPSSNGLRFWYREDFAPARTHFERAVLDPAAQLLVYDATAPIDEDRIVVILGSTGELQFLRAEVPVDRPWPGGDPVSALFEKAGLVPERLRPVAPGPRPGHADEWRAWRATVSGTDIDPTHVEVGTRGGWPVAFSVGPTVDVVESKLRAHLSRVRYLGTVSLPMIAAFTLFGLAFAVRNLRRREVDGPGARNLVLWSLAVGAARLALTGTSLAHPFDRPLVVFSLRLLGVLQTAVLLLVFYVAVEPVVRRYWPRILVGWTATLHGRWRSTTAGRALLIGAVVGTAWALLEQVDTLLGRHVGVTSGSELEAQPIIMAARGLVGVGALMAREIVDSVGRSGALLLILVFWRTILRFERLAVGALVLNAAVLMTLVQGENLSTSWLVLGLPIAASSVWILLRFGLLTHVVAGFIASLLRFAPLTLSFTEWWAPVSGFVLSSVFALATAGALLMRGVRSRPSRISS